LEIAHRKIERTFLRLSLGFLVGFIAFVFLCWGGCRAYSHFESRHLARRAAAYLSGGNVRDALLSARQAMQLEQSAPAMRVLAEVGERTNDRVALDWRRKVLELTPGSTADLLALASCALQFNKISEAEKALAAVSKDEEQTAAFHATSARVAEAKKDMDVAAKYWIRAAELEPKNKFYALHLGLLKLRSEDAATREAGRTLLERLRADAAQRAPATRALVVDAVAHREDPQKVQILAQELQGYNEALFSDRITYLDILRQLRDPDYTTYLTNIEKDAAANPADLAALLTWMNANQLSMVALDLVKSLPEEKLKAWPVPWSIAESYGKIADWSDLEKLTRNGNWGEFDFVRRAFLARSLRAQNKSAAAEGEWAGAATAAATNYQSLMLLARLVSEWGWKREDVDLLWQLAKYPESQQEALQTLYQFYQKGQETEGLYRVLSRMLELNPSDLRVQNNLAQVSLLLHVDLTQARQFAADLFHKEPSNSAYTSTYAFSLYQNGDAKGALRVMSTLPADGLKDPSVAAYYGVILVGAGEREKAQEYLEIGKKARLLPEEKALLERATANTK
jgi:predicted Zn-dependent protease